MAVEARRFHAGEEMVQRRAGTYEMASRVGRGIHRELWPAAEDFVADQRFVIVAARDAEGRLWASSLAGPRGFLEPEGEALFVGAVPEGGDPLAEAFAPGAAVGLLVIDPATRRRVRVNGRVLARTDAGLGIEVDEAFGNCPKYIQARQLVAADVHPAGPPAPAITGSLFDEGQVERIGRADTFFIASVHPERGADVSHRGGRPGFVRAVSEREVVFPDYAGNGMFNTLGNLSADPTAALLFVDFATGAALHLSGRAEIDWSAKASTEFAGVERVLRFHVERVTDRPAALPLRWAFREASPFNP
jgi:predicted pyridoxine 5'-phosphate oxidase superfamily flavin-nucleotide-binding protein